MAKEKILLVEDNPGLLKLGQAIFETGGYDVLTATDGLEAIDVLSREKVALVITDILMPNMDGYSLCYAIRHDEAIMHIPIIIYSATYTSHSDEELARNIGADMFIRKPATMNFLLQSATDLIEKPVLEKRLHQQELTDVMRQYSSRLIDKLEVKNNELEKAHAELIKRERRFRALIENNYEAITLRDATGNMIYQSPGAERIIGYKIEEALGLDAQSMFHPDDLPAVQQRMETSLRSPGTPIYGQHRVQHKDGHYIWLEGTVTNLLHDENVKAVVGNFRDITERKIAEEKIKTLNRLYAFVSSINQTIVHVDNTTALANEACRIAVDVGEFSVAWLGFINEANKTIDIVACHISVECTWDVITRIPFEPNTLLSSVLEDGKPYIVNDLQHDSNERWREYALQRGAGSFVFLPIKKGGKVIGLYTLLAAEADFFDEQEMRLLEEVSGDISFAIKVFDKEQQRKEMEEELAYNEARLRQAQAIAHVGSWELNYVTGIGTWSEETCRIYGLSLEDNTHDYESWLSFIHPDDRDNVLTHSNEMDRKLESFSIQHRIVRPDGEIRYVFSQAAYETDDKGNPTGLYGIVHDITQKREAEQALELSEANMRSIFDLIPQCIFAKDAEGKYLFTNKSFAQLYGVTPDALLNRKMIEVIPDHNSSDEFLEQDLEVISSSGIKTIPEQIFIDSDGNERTFYAIKVPYVEPGTKRKAVLGVAMDITEQKQAEKERSRMIADMMQRNNDLEQFSYIISHNLRSPIANIMGLAELITLPDLSKEDEKEIMEGVLSSVKRLDDITIDLNYILQVRQGINEQKELVRFSSLMSNIKNSIANIIRIEGVTINCEFQAINELFTVKSYLHSIFFNLISNSIKYRRADVNPEINIRSEKEDGYVYIVISDNGMGIDLQNRGKEVFRLYKRFHFHVEGKGIGLYMVKTQVESLGGKISVKSEVNKGTEFRLEFSIP